MPHDQLVWLTSAPGAIVGAFLAVWLFNLTNARKQ
jgi:hypothetical protein